MSKRSSTASSWPPNKPRKLSKTLSSGSTSRKTSRRSRTTSRRSATFAIKSIGISSCLHRKNSRRKSPWNKKAEYWTRSRISILQSWLKTSRKWVSARQSVMTRRSLIWSKTIPRVVVARILPISRGTIQGITTTWRVPWNSRTKTPRTRPSLPAWCSTTTSTSMKIVWPENDSSAARARCSKGCSSSKTRTKSITQEWTGKTGPRRRSQSQISCNFMTATISRSPQTNCDYFI